jgi:integrase
MVWPERDLALAALLAGTAVRASELCAPRIRDLVLDVEEPYVRVSGKGGVARDCPLPPELAKELNEAEKLVSDGGARSPMARQGCRCAARCARPCRAIP